MCVEGGFFFQNQGAWLHVYQRDESTLEVQLRPLIGSRIMSGLRVIYRGLYGELGDDVLRCHDMS